MNWKRILLTYAVALAIGGYLYLGSGGRETAVERSVSQLAPLLEFAAADAETLTLASGTYNAVLQRVDGRWTVKQPADTEVTNDLVEALIETLSRIPPIEIIADDNTSDAEFGLLSPIIVIGVETAAGVATTVSIGNRSPTRTAVYVRKDAAPTVYLLGLIARYQADLLLEELGGPVTNSNAGAG